MKAPKRIKRIALACAAIGTISLILTLAQSIYSGEDPDDAFEINGDFNPDLNDLNSKDKLIGYINSRLGSMKIDRSDTAGTVAVVDQVLRSRFNHGTARITFNDDYVAYILGKLFWDDLRMESSVDRILHHKVAVCNQTNIVFQSVMKEFGYPFRSIGLNRHQFTEVRYSNGWHIHDCDYEPVFEEGLPPSTEDLINDREYFYYSYAHVADMNYNPHFDDFVASKTYSILSSNEPGAKNLRRFHTVSGFYAAYGWIIWFGLAAMLFYIRRK